LSPQDRGIAKFNPDIQLFSDYRHATDARRWPPPRRPADPLRVPCSFRAATETEKPVSLVRIDQDGTAQVDDGAVGVGADAKSPRGVKVEFVGENGQRQTLYYFSANVDNDGFKPSGFMRFCERLGSGDAFVKSASYLMHRDHFSDVRDFLLEHSRLLLQDDSGIPATRFDQARWQLRLFGHYSGPISLFANRYQSKLAQLFDRGRAEPVEFGVGYRWRPQTSNLMLAVKTDAANDGAVAGAQPGQVSGEVPIVP
jgi:hypothetical protein